jgi:hypothetical protein
VFGAYYEWGDQYPPGSGSSYVVLGTISADGRSIISFGGGSHYWSDTAHNVYHEHKRLEAGDMELDSVDFEQGIFQFKISGPSVEYHSPVAGYQTYERDLFYTEQDHGIVGQTFDNPDCEPVIIVTFRK